MPEDQPSVINRKLDEAGLSQHDYVKAALKWQYNWIGLAGAAAFACGGFDGRGGADSAHRRGEPPRLSQRC